MVLMSLRLIIEDDEGATTIVPLGKDAITIGRQQGNTIQLTEKNVSRRHARLFPDSDAWVIEDLNSYNGIKVNDKAVEGRTSLREGDIVQIGDYHLAITEDVDKSTLNYGRTGAANDGTAAVDPLMASSSADLPRLSADELHALQSGPQQITPPPQPALMDSGPVPATYAVTPTYADEPKRGAGVLIGFGLVVLIALGGAFAWLATTGNEPDDEVAADGSEPKTKEAPDPPMPPEPAVVDDGLPEEPPPPEPDDAGADDLAIVDDDAGLDDGGEEIEIPPEPPEPIDPPPNNTTSKRPKSNKKKATPKPPPPPEPSGPSAEELLAEAKKLQFGNPREAYKKAKASYDKKKTQNALSVMASAACRMADTGKAKQAHSKLRGSLKADAEKFCASKGITL
jgi:predicted component of type VI protein secretion system